MRKPSSIGAAYVAAALAALACGSKGATSSVPDDASPRDASGSRDANGSQTGATCVEASPPTNVFVDILTGSGGCLPRSVQLDAQFRSTCKIYEARPASNTCRCSDGRRPVPTNVCDALSSRVVATGGAATDCICEIPEARGAHMTACQSDVDPASTVDGWCFIMRQCSRNDALLSECAANQPGKLRFLGAAHPLSDAVVLLACAGVTLQHDAGGCTAVP